MFVCLCECVNMPEQIEALKMFDCDEAKRNKPKSGSIEDTTHNQRARNFHILVHVHFIAVAILLRLR